MCVILHALKKKHLARLEVIQAMKHNSSGFFMSHWGHESRSPEGRDSIRTLNEDQALAFFDKVPDDDMFVMHARIPSKGVVSLDNVHGWEEDGILFCHNMTLSSLNGLMDAEEWKGTDSEYFFRKLFMPMHRGEHLADPTLKPGEMGPATKRLTALLCGDTNKFLFVMPDNTVIRAGKWSTIASDKRTLMEEREIEEVVGESVDIDGKVVKKTNKVKKEIEVEREFATVVASNTYYRASSTTTSYGGTLTTTKYGATRWNPKTKSFEPVSSAASPSTGGYHGGYSGAFCGYGDDADYYGDDYDAYSQSGYGGSAKKSEPAKDASRAKVKKSDISDDDIKKFMEWRKCIPDFKSVEEVGDTGTSLLFSRVSASGGKFDGSDLHVLFDVMLRCIIYNNIRENAELILSNDSLSFASDPDEFGLFTTESGTILDEIVPAEFDDSLAAFAVNAVNKLHDRMQLDVSGKDFVLPSEALNEMFLEFLNEVDYNIGMTRYMESSDSPATVNDVDKMFFARMSAVDNLLNLSFDHTVKANKDVERYARAAMVIGRKLKWIPAPLLLAPDRSMVTPDGGWEKSKPQSDFLETLNFIAEACVSEGDSLNDHDRRYVAELKNLGFDFDKKGSTEIFLPGFSSQDADKAEEPDEKDSKEDGPDKESGKGDPADGQGDGHEKHVLGDPENPDPGAEGDAK